MIETITLWVVTLLAATWLGWNLRRDWDKLKPDSTQRLRQMLAVRAYLKGQPQ